jgi:integration host factor subunit beta
MTKSELITALAAQYPHLPFTEVDKAVRTLLASIAEAMSQGQRVEVRDFGSFSLHFHKARKGRNPKTGEDVFLEAKHVPYFKVGKELKDRVSGEA